MKTKLEKKKFMSNPSLKKWLIIILIGAIFVVSSYIHIHQTQKSMASVSGFGNENLWLGEYSWQTMPSSITTGMQYISLSEFETINGSGASFNLQAGYLTPSTYRIRIDTAEELWKLSNKTNSTTVSERNFYLSAYYVLGNHIDYFSQIILNRPFMPIGTPSSPFIGQFDGKGFEITNLFFGDDVNLDQQAAEHGIDTGPIDSRYIYYAMFSEVGSAGVVRRLGIINPFLRVYIRPTIMTHAAAMIGNNAGLVEYVYVIDNRTTLEAGYDTWGGFKISGLLSRNTGIFRHAYYSSIRVASRNTGQDYQVQPVVFENTGTLHQIYYDLSIYNTSLVNNILTPIPNVVGATTSNLITQNGVLTGELWVSRDYTAIGASESNTYPNLQGISGLGTEVNPFEINNAIDMVLFAKLIDFNAYYRNKFYRITRNIDMLEVAPTAYITPRAIFSGTLTGEIRSGDVMQFSYPGSSDPKTNHHAIINLNIRTGSVTADRYYAGLVSNLSGTIRNLNMIGGSIVLTNTDDNYGRNFYIGSVVSYLSGGTIDRVHSSMQINLGSDRVGYVNFGGIVGGGYGTIQVASNSGSLFGGVHPFVLGDLTSNNAVGGIIGSSVSAGMLSVEEVQNMGAVFGVGFTGSSNNYGSSLGTNVGGIIGRASTSKLIKVANRANIYATQLTGSPFINHVNIGGIVGQYNSHLGGNTTRYDLYNSGSININNIQTTGYVKASGIAVFKGTSPTTIYKAANNGSFVQTNVLGTYDFGGIAYDDLTGVSVLRGYNFASFTFTPGRTYQVSPIHFSNDTVGTYIPLIEESINYGDISITSSPTGTTPILLSGITNSQYVSINRVHNYGNISVTGTQSTTGIILVSGIVRVLNHGRYINNAFNEGALSVTPSNTSTYQISVAGIVNTNNNNVTLDSNLLPIAGSNLLDNVVNNGVITVTANTTGLIAVGGITVNNNGFVRNAANLANLLITNNTTTASSASNGFVKVGGIASNNGLATSKIYDSVNYGRVVSITRFDAWAGGIVAESTNQYSIIAYSMNFGEVSSFAVGGILSPAGGILSCTTSPYPRARSGGIIGTGKSGFNNVVNRGVIGSNDVSGGIYGVVDFVSISETEGTKMWDSINYGTVRRISSRSGTTFTYAASLPSTTTLSCFFGLWRPVVHPTHGAIIGMIYQGGSATASSAISYRYILNTDTGPNMIGRVPAIQNANWSNPGEADITTMATTKIDDRSPVPFSDPTNPIVNDRYIKSYFNNAVAPNPAATEGTQSYNGGIYHSSFFMRTGLVNGVPIENYAEYIAYYQNSFLAPATRNLSVFASGMYVLANSTGQTNGGFMPANIHLEALDLIGIRNTFSGIDMVDDLWRAEGSPINQNKTNYKFNQMYQLEYEVGTTIFDLELYDQTSGSRLSNPVINLQNNTMTYYISANATIGSSYKVDQSTIDLSIAATLKGGTYANQISLDTYSFSPINAAQGSNNGPFTITVLAEHPLVYRQYQVYIVVTPNSSLTLNAAPNGVFINGVGQTAGNYTNSSNTITVSSSSPVAFSNGSIEIRYSAINIPNGFDIKSLITLYDSSNNPVDAGLYIIENGVVNSTYSGGVWSGTLTYRIIVNQALPMGTYRVSFQAYGITYQAIFTKQGSTSTNILAIDYDSIGSNTTINTGTRIITSTIQYGNLLDFSSTTLLVGEIPSYLNSIQLVPFARVVSSSLNQITISNDGSGNGIRTYQIIMVVRPEAGSGFDQTWTHNITERVVDRNVAYAYKNGNPINLAEGITFEREELNVAFWLEYQSLSLFGGYGNIIPTTVYKNDVLQTAGSFESYLSRFVDGDGVYAEFFQSTDPATYKIGYRYLRTNISLPYNVTVVNQLTSQTTSESSLSWVLDLNEAVITKLEGKDTYLRNIIFMGDTVIPQYPILKNRTQYEQELPPTIAIFASSIYYNGITLTGPNRDDEIFVEGFVQQTNLIYYAPEFVLPLGAIIERYDEVEQEYTTQLFDDFRGNREVTYRVTSEDGTVETYYYIQVTDIFYNVLFRYHIVIEDPLDQQALIDDTIFVIFKNLATIVDTSGGGRVITSVEAINNQLIAFYRVNQVYYQFDANSSGDYLITLDLPSGFDFIVKQGSPSIPIEPDYLNLLSPFPISDYYGYHYYIPPSPRGSFHEFTIYVSSSTVAEEPWGIKDIWRFWKDLF